MNVVLTVAVEPPDEAVNMAIHDGLVAFSRKTVNWPDRRHFTVTLRDADGALRGGLVASVNFDVVRIDDLFIQEEFRRGGHGAQLLNCAEEEGQRLGAGLACLSTYSWQARPFYEKQGYELFAELPYANGAHRLFWLKKTLRA
jgi:GNAT superfamily N-acetyltransferase